MVCREHHSETAVGVCPLCLRDRLLLLASPSPSPSPSPPAATSRGGVPRSCAKRPSLISSLLSFVLPRRTRSPPPRARRCPAAPRGMSPDRGSDEDDSPSSSPALRNPGTTPARRRQVMASGFAVCFNPMVRASPHHPRRHNQVTSGDVAAVKGRSCCAGNRRQALGPNRSRKLADYGRFK